MAKNKEDKIEAYDIYMEQMRDLEEMATKITKMTKVTSPYFYGKVLSGIYDIENEIMNLINTDYKELGRIIFAKEGDE